MLVDFLIFIFFTLDSVQPKHRSWSWWP